MSPESLAFLSLLFVSKSTAFKKKKKKRALLSSVSTTLYSYTDLQVPLELGESGTLGGKLSHSVLWVGSESRKQSCSGGMGMHSAEACLRTGAQQ